MSRQRRVERLESETGAGVEKITCVWLCELKAGNETGEAHAALLPLALGSRTSIAREDYETEEEFKKRVTRFLAEQEKEKEAENG